jgi:hypothetical protein
MKLLRTLSAIAALSLNVLFAISVSAQPSFDLKDMLDLHKDLHKMERAQEVMQDNELEIGVESIGSFFCNPLQLNGYSLDYGKFNIAAKGKLTLIKGNAVTGMPMLIPFYIYLRRDGKILGPQSDKALKKKLWQIDLPPLLMYAEPGDQLIIEPVNKEDWQAKRILKLLGGC